MASPREQLLIVDSEGSPVALDDLIAGLRDETARVLADDEIGVIVYVGDLDLYELTPTASGEFISRRVTQISQPRFPAMVLRKQIGARVFSVTADAVFVIRKGNTFQKVRAEKLKPGMVLESGEKVFK